MSNEVRVVGLSGYATAGKDTAAAALIAEGWRRHSFADILREFLYALNPAIPSPTSEEFRLAQLVDAYGWDQVKRDFPEARILQQRCGTDAGRNVLGEDVWVKAALARVGPGERVVFTDVRFPNEADAIRAAGGVLIRVERPGVGPINDHPSEVSLDHYQFDYTLTNAGAVGDLHDKVRELMADDRFKQED